MKRKTLRQKFEAWHKRGYPGIPLDRQGEAYVGMFVRARWSGYSAGYAQGRRK